MLLVLVSCDYVEPKDREYTIGTIERLYHINGGSVKVSFVTKSNKKALAYSTKIRDVRVGEMYWLYYDKNDSNPTRAEVYYTAPFIKDTLNYAEGKAYIYTNAIDERYIGCNFSYKYNGKKYHKYQRLVDLSVRKGDTVDVLINKNRPYIAYVKGSNAITK